MGLTSDLGIEQTLPSIDLTGIISGSWMYLAFIIVVGVLAILGIGFLMFIMTYNKEIILFENVSGQGYQVVLKTRARIIKLGNGGEELLKTFFGGHFVSAYGRKMGTNTYWYAKGQDGYWYNIILGDLDAKKGMLDIEPIDRDVRMFHVALDRMSQQTYGKTGFLEKYGNVMIAFAFLLILVLGMWFIIGKLGESLEPLKQSTEITLKIQEQNLQMTERLEEIISNMGIKNINTQPPNQGLEPAS